MTSQVNENFVVTLINMHELGVSCVLHIIAFDEDEIRIMTKQGKMLVEGKDLKVESLSKENESIIVTGEISSIVFQKNTLQKSGWLGKGRK